jgi:hypothetical protein
MIGALVALSWANWLAIAALALAGISTFFALRADSRAGRAEKRSERSEGREEERLERERLEADVADRARLVIWPKGSSATSDHRRFGFTIRNHGKATAHDVYVYLAGEDSQDASTPPQPKFTLAPDASDDTHGVPVPLHYTPDDLRFWVTWFDGGGFHRRPMWMPPTL